MPNWTLSPQQETAVDLLVSGQTLTETAKAIDVCRQTVSEWLNHHPGFQAKVNDRRRELWEATVDRLRGLLPKALDVIGQELEGENPLPAAIHVLKACRLYGVLPPTGPTEPEDAAIAGQLRASQRRHDRLLADVW